MSISDRLVYAIINTIFLFDIQYDTAVDLRMLRNIMKTRNFDHTLYLILYSFYTTLTMYKSGNMSQIMTDDLNYRLLRRLVYGSDVSVNIHCLSKTLKKHRNTIRRRVEEIFENKVLNPPFFPFIGLYQEYPLLVLVWTVLPYEEAVEKWIREDPHVFAALRSRYSEYNTLIAAYHKDITSYQLWREKIATEQQVPLINGSLPPSLTSFFSTQLMIKYDPNAAVYLLEEDVRKKGYVILNDHKLDKLSFQIVRLLTKGKCIKINETKLSKELRVHRKTIIKRIQELMKERWISNPACRFPNFFAPPKYISAICKLEIKSFRQEFIQNIRNDPHVTMAFDIKEQEFNILLFGTFRNLEEELKWEVKYGLYLPNRIGKVDIQYFAPGNTVNIGERNVSLGIIDKKYMYFRT